MCVWMCLRGTALDISQYRTKETTSKLIIPTTHRSGSRFPSKQSFHYSSPKYFSLFEYVFLEEV